MGRFPCHGYPFCHAELRRSEALRKCFLLLLCVLLPLVPASGQITGRAIDESGNPITHALVELGGVSGVLEQTRSGVRGWFDLTPNREATWVRVSQFGFESRTADLKNISRPLEIVLAPRPFELEEVRVVAPSGSCPSEDDSSARAAWSRAISPMRDLSSEPYWAAYLIEWRKSRGLGSEFGPLDEVTYDFAMIAGTPRSTYRIWRKEVLEPLLLARLRTPVDMQVGPGSAWRLPSLEGPGVPLLFSSAFASESVIGWTPDGEGVVLCQEDRQGTRIRLGAVFDDSGRVTDLYWKLWTPPPVEEAGGRVSLPSSGLPLPETSYFWHREPRGRNLQDFRVFSPWFVGESDRVMRRLLEFRDSLTVASRGQ